MLTQTILKQILPYDPETGLFERNMQVKKNRQGGVGSRDFRGYTNIRIGKVRYLAHRLAWFYTYNEWPSEIDHINHDKSDNRLANLRVATRAQNCSNRLSRAKSGFEGVFKSKTEGKWHATITVDRKTKFLGAFNSPEAANAAYCAAAKNAFGEFSCNERRV